MRISIEIERGERTPSGERSERKTIRQRIHALAQRAAEATSAPAPKTETAPAVATEGAQA